MNIVAATLDLDMSPKKAQRESYLQPGREGKKSLLLWVPEDLHKKLKIASVEDDITLQEIGESALRAYLAKRSKR